MIGDILKVAGAAVEYGGAAQELVASLKRGDSLEASLRAFAAETENEIDDKIVEGAVEAIEELAHLLRTVAVKALVASSLIQTLSDTIEENTPAAREKAGALSSTAAGLAEFLDSLTIRD